MGIVIDVVIGILVAGLVIVNQLRVRVVSARRLRIAAVAGAIGVVAVVRVELDVPAPPVAIGLLVLGLLIGAGLAVARAGTLRLWRRDGRWVAQGHAATAGLWVAAIAVHLGLDAVAEADAPAAGPLSAASILLFVAVSFGVQTLVTLRRVRALEGAPQASAA